jgi:hypothetical protein
MIGVCHVDHFETVRLRKGGVPVEVSLTIFPIRDRTGEIIGASKLARDITEQKRTAEKMHPTRRVEEGREIGTDRLADPFPFPAHQTGRARFEHPAFRQTSPTSSRRPQMHIAEP